MLAVPLFRQEQPPGLSNRGDLDMRIEEGDSDRTTYHNPGRTSAARTARRGVIGVFGGSRLGSLRWLFLDARSRRGGLLGVVGPREEIANHSLPARIGSRIAWRIDEPRLYLPTTAEEWTEQEQHECRNRE